MNKVGLYIHVPFCRRKCLYCDFYSLENRESMRGEYSEAVIRNIRAYNEHYDTVYFGGGTPSLLAPEMIQDILTAADICGGAEITMEANPDSVSLDKLKGYRAAGVNRVSFGVQSFDDNELRLLGRLHDSAQARAAIKNARLAGFENISADLMLGLPFQDTETVERNISELCELGVDHISAYMLKIEEGTPLSRNEELCRASADDDLSAEIYLKAVDMLSGAGLFQYEISNFAKKGFECRHNLKYWRCEDYIGIGAGAHSCYGGKRFWVPCDADGFTRRDTQEIIVTDDAPCSEEEKMMLALRLSEGYCAKHCSDGFWREAELFERHGLLKISGGVISLTPEGMLVYNEIICRLALER